MKLLGLGRFGGTQQQAREAALLVAFAQQPEVFEHIAIERNAARAQLRVGAATQAGEALIVGRGDVALQLGGVGQGVEAAVEQLFDGGMDLGFGVVLAAHGFKRHTRLEGVEQADQIVGGQVLIGLGQRRVGIGEGGIEQKRRPGQFVAAVQAAQRQLGQAVFLFVGADPGHAATRAHVQAVGVKVVDFQVSGQLFEQLIARQGLRRGGMAEQVQQGLPGLVVLGQVPRQSLALVAGGVAVPGRGAVFQAAVQQALGAQFQALTEVGQRGAYRSVQLGKQVLGAGAGVAQGPVDIQRALASRAS